MPSASSAVVLDCVDSTGLSSIGEASFCVAIFYDTGHGPQSHQHGSSNRGRDTACRRPRA
jgi:hypothetical protein